MGVRLIVEVLDHWQDVGLTAGERNDLIVLAENANDGSRLTWGPVHAPYILKRANKTPEGWKNSIGKLLRKKVLTTHVPGRIKQVAVYHLEPLCPDPPHSGYKGLCTKPEKGVAGTETLDPEEGHPTGDPVETETEEGHLSGDPMGNPTGDPLGQEGHLTGVERVTGEVTPTPLYSSFNLSSKDSPSSSMAEDSKEGDRNSDPVTDGGGGGMSPELEKITEQAKRTGAFVDSLDYRGRAPGRQQRMKLGQAVTSALLAGWTENGLRRYLDISDDPKVRSAAALYLHRLSADELPDASVGIDTQLPPACWDCLGLDPATATDVTLRVNPITSDPCPNCHPAAVGQSPKVPHACDACIRENPAAQFNIRFRYRLIDGENQGCPDCHPTLVARQTLTGTDAKVSGWMAIAEQLRQEGQQGGAPSKTDQRVRQAVEAGTRVQRQQGPQLGRRYDNETWRQPANPAEAAKVPHCGDPNCDPVTRLKTEPDWTGDPHTSVCSDCHPAMKF